jgi:hypothetical protein
LAGSRAGARDGSATAAGRRGPTRVAVGDANNVNITPDGADTIDGVNAAVARTAQGPSLTLRSSGSAGYAIGKFWPPTV